MKKFGILMMTLAALTVFNGCQKQELTDRQLADEEVQPQVVVQPDVYVENGYLAFKNIEAVDSTILLLNKMTTSEKETWENLGFKESLKFELAHRKIIEQFGRYPHRNKILGREFTPEELEFLKNDGSSF